MLGLGIEYYKDTTIDNNHMLCCIISQSMCWQVGFAKWDWKVNFAMFVIHSTCCFLLFTQSTFALLQYLFLCKMFLCWSFVQIHFAQKTNTSNWNIFAQSFLMLKMHEYRLHGPLIASKLLLWNYQKRGYNKQVYRMTFSHLLEF